ncbi:tol-pal system-associated acyl-CoA thioesterase [Lutimaribacter saemankumensis]|uniref:Acyl-CoA thioester hydrolase n=1 Tax=Lutimaribacter saemankumensis TaxID=490829 RepID=A0A1G8MEG9_9RHOB|nr:tol-pal system-associated acyl-CoA thioesterase [Lutimaribacter saemankumensis]SDI66378.1 acyl-CoA thioester hydrolase [Lutimaribacter saemankumensis]
MSEESPKVYTLPIRVYYEDTDMAGIVYYANYLRYIERGRSEWVREVGLDQNRMKDEDGIVFAVRRVEADYLAPARLDDRLDVLTWVAERKPARMIMGQEVRRGDKVLFRALVTVICMTLDGRPVRMPVWDEG